MERRTVLQRLGAVGAAGALVLAGCQGPANDPAAGRGDGDGGDSGRGDGNGSDSDGGGSDGTPDETDAPWERPVTDVTVETVDSGCAGDERPAAEVDFDPGASTVSIFGTVRAPTPCHRTTVESVEFDDESGLLEVVLGTAPGTEDACEQCTGSLAFECQVAVAGDLPSTVSVRQADVRLARVERGDGPGTPGQGVPVADSTFEVVGRSGASGEPTADVTFHEDENRVTVTGTIHGSDGCKTAVLGDVTDDAGDDRVTVSVVTENRDGAKDRTCTQAIVAIAYEATVTFEGGVPSAASVVHDGHEVASAAHGSASASPPSTTGGTETAGAGDDSSRVDDASR